MGFLQCSPETLDSRADKIMNGWLDLFKPDIDTVTDLFHHNNFCHSISWDAMLCSALFVFLNPEELN